MRKFKQIIRSCFAFLVIILTVSHFQLANAQSSDEEKSRFIRYVEEQISSPNAKISLNGLTGTLSSNVSLESITIADKDGVWLSIEKPQLVWSRSALLSGELLVDSLVAQKINWIREAAKDESLPNAEATPLALPDLPVSINIKSLDVADISFGESIFGLAASTSLKGSMALSDGSLDLKLNAERLDGPRGNFKIHANYVAQSKELKIDVNLNEPANGIIANLLNIENKPPVKLTIKGDAPLEKLLVDIGFQVAGEPILTGTIRLNEQNGATRANFDLGGPLAKILPQKARSFFGDNSQIDAEAVLLETGGIEITSFLLDSGAIALWTSAKTLSDGFLSAINLEFSVKTKDGSRVALPFGENQATLQSARMGLRYDANNSENWSGEIDVVDFISTQTSINKIDISAQGLAKDIVNTAKRAVTFDISGLLTGFSTKRPGVEDALGEMLKLNGRGNWKAGSPLELGQLTLSGDSFQIASAGEFSQNTFTGAARIIAKKLDAFSALLDRDLNGSANLRADGTVSPLSGGFDLSLSGTGRRLEIGDPNIDPLLEGETILSGAISRSEKGLAFDKLRIANDQVKATVNGLYASNLADISAIATLQDISSVAPRGSGGASVVATINGNQKPFDAKIELSMAEGRLEGRKIDDLGLTLEGLVSDHFFRGELRSRGSLNGKPVKLAGYINATENEQSAQNFIAQVGGAKINGDFRRNQSGLFDGDLKIAATDISDLAALALIKAKGAINGTIRLDNSNDRQTASTNLKLKNVEFENNRVATASLTANGTDLLGNPVVNANIKAQNIRVSGVGARQVQGTISTKGDITQFNLTAALVQNNAKVATKGIANLTGATKSVRIDQLSVVSNVVSARLIRPTNIRIRKGVTDIELTNLKIGTGELSLGGTVSKQLNLKVNTRNIPLSIINTFRPDIGAHGTLNGNVQIKGTTKKPEIGFNVSGQNLSSAALMQAGVTPLSANATGQFSDNVVVLNSARATNAQNLNLNAQGRIPLQGGGMALSANGTAPLSFAQDILKARGATLTGNARFNVNVTGSLKSPTPEGLLAIENGALTDPLSNLRVINIGLLAGINANSISINKASANLASGGRLSAGGSIGLRDAMPANISVSLLSARYTDGQTFDTTVDGKLTLTGNLQADPTLGGQISLGRTEISIPETFTSSSPLLEVEHVNPSNRTKTTLDRIEQLKTKGTPRSRPSVLRLNLTVNAPNKIFVRGRGLDAELGGRIALRGPVTNVRPVGGFTLRRGRFSLLGQRLDLDQGLITLTGDLNPTIDLSASTQADDVQATITIAGRVADPQITFSSSPELPQDEILARIIFGRGISDLSAGQIARLVSVASELSGGGSSLADSVRKSTGLDDLDIVQDEKGGTSAKVGKYINDNVYLGLQAGSKNEATINLDITDTVKARGAVDSDGNTSLGIFVEKDY